MIQQHHYCSSVLLFTEQGKDIYMNPSVYLCDLQYGCQNEMCKKNDMFKWLVNFQCHTTCTLTDLQQYVTCSKMHVHKMEALQIIERKCQTTSVFQLRQFRKTENNYVEVKYSSQAETPLKSHSAPSLFPQSWAMNHLGLKLKSTQMQRWFVSVKKQ